MKENKSMRQCNVCLSVDIQSYLKEYNQLLVKCQKCGYVYTDPSALKEGIYNQSYFSGEYDNINYSGTDFLSRTVLRFAEHIKGIKKYSNGKNLLDIGCALGTFLLEVKKAGFSGKGYDISSYAADYCQKFLNLEVKSGELRDAFPENSFNVVTMFHVLEHVPNPVQFLNEEVQPFLVPGGMIAIEVPNFDSLEARNMKEKWIDLRPDQHLSHFNSATLRSIVEKSGFDVVFLTTRTWFHQESGLVGALSMLCGRPSPKLSNSGKSPQSPQQHNNNKSGNLSASITSILRKTNRVLFYPFFPLFQLLAKWQGNFGLGKNLIVYARKMD
jgi:2-polyprenyl-3-methyl-5-hydroxy-6-metoxy-1,4-benzoquinol methylase